MARSLEAVSINERGAAGPPNERSQDRPRDAATVVGEPMAAPRRESRGHPRPAVSLRGDAQAASAKRTRPATSAIRDPSHLSDVVTRATVLSAEQLD